MKSILIVDDNITSLKQISAQLADAYEVSLAKSGELALKICTQEKPDLILLDLEMPGLDGFETIKALKEDPLLNQIPVIFLTGRHDSETEIKCLESGAMDFISKPVNTEILRHRVQLHLEFSSYQLYLEKVIRELEDNIGISFAELVECKDYNIFGHVLRTGIFAGILAEELLEEGIFGSELSALEIDRLKRAAPFHDIGKIGVSDVILLKRGPLTGEEYQEIQKHTAIGREVLQAIYERSPNQRYLEMAMIIAEGHHENFDGTGYPQGLKGNAIPLCCRIFSVANVYDACVTDRVYRRSLGHEEACALILGSRNREFDPRIVDAFEKVQEKFALAHTESQFPSKKGDWGEFHEANFGGR